MSYSVAIAGTTSKTLLCAQALWQHPQFEISLVITPAAKAVGREQIITPNPLQKFADSNQISTVLIKNIVDEQVKKEIKSFERPDFLLVVDFGYLIPQWLLDYPQIMPLNIHPSDLPKWRGSSPGQLVLKNGEATSAVSLIKMTTEFDQGPIVWQKEFVVGKDWTQTEYYQHSFKLAVSELPQIMIKLADKQITPTPQPATSPTPIASKLTKQDAFVDWKILKKAIDGDQQLALDLERATRAYSPWPLLWTEIPTSKGPRRMQIITTFLDQEGRLTLNKVKVAGLAIKPYREIKNIIQD
jgi:methionyl-tRNA formyltransferase